jgi:transcriptional regulator with PAS, ATPase and Fis domain
MQVKLLRVLQEKVYEPLGATKPVKADVRVIVATNKNITEMVNCGEFREDLYYRVNVVSIKLPPLKARRCDIPLLCDHFISRFNKRYDKSIKGLSEEALQLLMSHDFPGNIRELENIIEHAFIFCKNEVINSVHLPASFKERTTTSVSNVFSKIKSFEELERMYLKSVLRECKDNKNIAAERLGIHKSTLFRKMRQYGIE